MKKVAPSHMQVKCPLTGCQTSVRKDRMKDHLRVIHGETKYVPPTQKLLHGFFTKKKNDKEQVRNETYSFGTTQPPENSIAEVSRQKYT